MWLIAYPITTLFNFILIFFYRGPWHVSHDPRLWGHRRTLLLIMGIGSLVGRFGYSIVIRGIFMITIVSDLDDLVPGIGSINFVEYGQTFNKSPILK